VTIGVPLKRGASSFVLLSLRADDDIVPLFCMTGQRRRVRRPAIPALA
jgi:hypothetical protein